MKIVMWVNTPGRDVSSDAMHQLVAQMVGTSVSTPHGPRRITRAWVEDQQVEGSGVTHQVIAELMTPSEKLA